MKQQKQRKLTDFISNLDDTPQKSEDIEEVSVTEETDEANKNYAEQFFETFESKQKKPTIEDTHTRTTFLVENDLRKRLDKLAKGKRGFKTSFVNTALRILLDEAEGKQKK
ncbi:hypothetical protein CHCC15075_1702 [Bacillus licheniformis]|uniref:CopG family transcriptional regulator n=1 Tax=Bacillus licheniformis TaxID=1402 RepID=A0AB37GN01_BACLI|nr:MULTISPECIES: hypothetical protein [Bacillus]AYC54163.1 hypothetical protein C7M53_23240 [Bacillus licheniformis]MDD0822647.1 hypothetical protein [Bacillus cereus]MED1082837.1 hypothetical protein [Bacillus licheniformis]QPR70560.1 hypothetical protein I6G80_00170 [Bacillus licheniformis]TWL13344.1 hypothetical protein CHCC16874_1867 [Bacillus licheniformis]